MAPKDHEPILNDDDALSLWVGRVTRTHAKLEYDVDNVYRFRVDGSRTNPTAKR